MLVDSERAKFEFLKKMKIIYSFSLGNDKVANSLIQAGANVNAVAKNSWTPIFYAVVNGKNGYRFDKY